MINGVLGRFLLAGCSMVASELIAVLARHADCSEAVVRRVLLSLHGTVASVLKKGGVVNVGGFGTFSVRSKVARFGVNPRTGERISIPAKKLPGFRASKKLNDQVK